MNWRWYFTGLIVALTIIGASIEKSAVPNQEIVVQFNADSRSSDDAQQAISEITNQLKVIGVEDVQVSEMLDGALKVTYYSTIDISVIKNLFNKQNKIELGDTAFNETEGSSQIPFTTDSNTYKLEVVKIQNDYASDLGFHGLPVEIKSLKDQYLNQILSLGNSEINFGLKNNGEREICKNYHYVALSIDNTSHKIPEVRAGPLS